MLQNVNSLSEAFRGPGECGRAPSAAQYALKPPNRGPRQGARRSSNIVTVSVERVRAPNERLSHHRTVRGQRLNAQTTRSDSLTRVHKRRTVLAHAPRRGSWRLLVGAVILSRCRLSVSGHPMSDCPITGWYGASVSVLKHPATDRFHARKGLRRAFFVRPVAPRECNFSHVRGNRVPPAAFLHPA